MKEAAGEVDAISLDDLDLVAGAENSPRYADTCMQRELSQQGRMRFGHTYTMTYACRNRSGRLSFSKPLLDRRLPRPTLRGRHSHAMAKTFRT